MFSFLKRKKGITKLATIVSKRADTTIFSHSGKNKSTEFYFIKVMHPDGKLEEFGVSPRLYQRAQKGGRVQLLFNDSFLDKIVLGT